MRASSALLVLSLGGLGAAAAAATPNLHDAWSLYNKTTSHGALSKHGAH